MKLIIVQCCATCQHQRGWLDNMHCERHQIQVHPYTICYDYDCDHSRVQRLKADIDTPNIARVDAKMGHVIKAYRADGWPLCPNCGDDELWSRLFWNGDGERPPIAEYIAAGLQCYYCGWSNEKPIITRSL